MNEHSHGSKPLEWLRFVLNPESKKASVQDWQEVYDFATRQAIVGICDPTRYDDVRMPQDLLFAWISSSALSSSYVISRHFQSLCALANFTSGATSLLSIFALQPVT